MSRNATSSVGKNIEGAPNLLAKILFPATEYYELSEKTRVLETSGRTGILAYRRG
ncbi:MAG TPA: hypothetical protein VNN76_10440 [Bacteroidota bacterium]|nr:hypothetical protein [Bacteroidota bacterium]